MKCKWLFIIVLSMFFIQCSTHHRRSVLTDRTLRDMENKLPLDDVFQINSLRRHRSLLVNHLYKELRNRSIDSIVLVEALVQAHGSYYATMYNSATQKRKDYKFTNIYNVKDDPEHSSLLKNFKKDARYSYSVKNDIALIIEEYEREVNYEVDQRQEAILSIQNGSIENFIETYSKSGFIPHVDYFVTLIRKKGKNYSYDCYKTIDRK